LKWLQYLSFGIGVIWLAVIAGTDELIYTAVVLFILFMGYFGIKQVGIFTESAPQKIKEEPNPETPVVEIQYNQPLKPSAEPEATIDPIVEITDKRKYSRSGLTGDMAESLHKELVQLMDREKVYSESELSLAQLAKRLGVHPNYLSQVINEKEGKNFYDYINTLRIEEFKRLIANPANQRFTILSLAYEVGFNSKSSFNRYFKKETSKSPSEYLRDLNIVEQ
jgi:AraC-like DNA-binding protein